MADKSRLASLSLEENEQLSEGVREFPCLCDKSKKEYKGKNVVESAWKPVAEKLEFLSEVRKLLLIPFSLIRRIRIF